MNIASLIYSCILFIVLSPNILFKIPSKGSKNIVAITHAVLFGIVLYFTQTRVVSFSRKNLEGIGSGSSSSSSGSIAGSSSSSASIAGSSSSSSASIAGSSTSPSGSIAGSSTSPSASIASSSPSTTGSLAGSSPSLVGSTHASIASGSFSPAPTTTSSSPFTKTEKTITDASNTNIRRGNSVVYYVAPSFIVIALIAGIAVIVTSRK